MDKYKLSNLVNVKLSDYINYVPLPNIFILDKNIKDIVYINGKYIHRGISSHNIIFANINIPFYTQGLFPFTFPIIIDNSGYLINSIYYYEITIDTNIFRKEWNDMNISIGYSEEIDNPNDMILGWYKNSIGYNSFDGSITNWDEKDNNSDNKNFGYGDTIGAGVIYENENYKIFFTLNGIKFNRTYNISMKTKLIPAIAINYNAMISTNFSTKPFIYKNLNIKK